MRSGRPPTFPARLRLGALALAAIAASALARTPRAEAGGGPETTVVVENEDSPLSRAVANAWVRARGIPEGRVCSIPAPPSLHRVDVETFRTRMLAPLRAFLAERGLTDRVDLVAWSVDLPVAVDFSADGASAMPQTPAVGSTTGLAFLEGPVLARDAVAYGDFRRVTHGYFRRSPATTGADASWPTRAFSSRVAWGDAEEPEPLSGPDDPRRQRLHAMLGWIGPFGNTAPEVLEGLRRAVAADGTAPKGTVYLCRSADAARTGPRAPFFEETAAERAALGGRAVVLEKDDGGQTGVVPRAKEDVIGAVVGAADFSWADCGSRLLPGAFADHLTSFAATFDHGGQTKCAEWIRHGAAATCGTVVEPLNAWTKFPVPRLHVHLAAGASAAEAFHMAVAAPYQTLLLGDPLSRPFARFSKVSVEPLPSPCRGTVEVRAKAVPPEGRTVATLELWVDGGFVAEAAPGAPLPWDTTRGDDGVREVRVVAVEAGLVATRSSGLAAATVANGPLAPPTLVPPRGAAFDRPLDLSGRAPGAARVEVLANGRRVAEGTVTGGAWSAKGVPAAAFGLGPSNVVVRALADAVPAARSAPLALEVGPPAPRRPSKPRGKGATKPGFLARLVDAAGKASDVVLPSLGGPGADPVEKAVDAKGKGPWKKATVEGEFEVKASGVHQLDVLASGLVRVEVDGKSAVEPAPAGERGRRARYGLVALEPGWHALRIELLPDGPVDLVVLLSGAQVAAPLVGRHAP